MGLQGELEARDKRDASRPFVACREFRSSKEVVLKLFPNFGCKAPSRKFLIHDHDMVSILNHILVIRSENRLPAPNLRYVLWEMSKTLQTFQ